MNILILTLSRSGHHAILNWMAEQIPGRVEHHNNTVLGWNEGGLLSPNGRIETYSNPGEGESRIFSIETFDMEDLSRVPLPEDCKTFLVVRDHYNWIASCLAGGGAGARELTTPFDNERGERKPGTIELWKRQIRFLQGEQEGVIGINYDAWCVNPFYRRIIIETGLGCEFTDSGYNTIPKFGGGSSFTRFDYDGSAERMPVTRRWENFRTDSDYIRMVSDPELIRLSQEYFSISFPLGERT